MAIMMLVAGFVWAFHAPLDALGFLVSAGLLWAMSFLPRLPVVSIRVDESGLTVWDPPIRTWLRPDAIADIDVIIVDHDSHDSGTLRVFGYARREIVKVTTNDGRCFHLHALDPPRLHQALLGFVRDRPQGSTTRPATGRTLDVAN